MKRQFVTQLFVILISVFCFFSLGYGFSSSVTLTAPAINKLGCEKIGSVSITLPPGAILTAGDWWYMDLPTDVTICRDIDYFIVGATSDAEGSYIEVGDEANQIATHMGGDSEYWLFSIAARPDLSVMLWASLF